MTTGDASEAPPTRGKRRRATALTEKEIVDAALEIIRTDGVDSLSMRRLSRELGRSTMAPYWHVEDKQQLLDLVAKEVLAEVQLPAPDSGQWDDRLRDVVTAIDARLRKHPGIAEVLFDRMQNTDHRLILGMLDILQSSGLSDTDVLLGYAVIHTYLFGRYQVVVRAEAFAPTDEESAALARMAAIVPTLTGQDFFTFGVETIIMGLRMRVPGTASPMR